MPTPKSHAWRQPFSIGQRYRVRHDFGALRDSFRAGEELTFVSDAYSHYHGYCAYFFSEPGSSKLRVWDLHDDEQLSLWSGHFEEIHP